MNAVAVIGLGDLGMAFAVRLHQQGLEVQAVERDGSRCDEWQRVSGRSATTTLAGITAERVFVCVRTTSQAETILNELIAAAPPSTRVVYVVTTLEPAFARRLGTFARPHLRVIELPISGGKAGALRGDLAVMVGGGSACAEDVDFVTDTLARVAFSFARYGDATLVKLLNNALGACNAAAFANCLELAEEAGIDPAQCAGVLRAASGSSWMAENFAVLIDDLLTKDVALLRRELGRVPVADLSDGASFEAELARARALLTR